MLSNQSNQDKNIEHYNVFLRWLEGKSHEDLMAYTHKRKKGDVRKHTLNLKKIDNELKVGSSFNQNRLIRNKIAKIEEKMLLEGLLDPDEKIDSLKTSSNSSPLTDKPPTGGLNANDRKRLTELEDENAYLREELKAKGAALKRYKQMDRFISETMRWPR